MSRGGYTGIERSLELPYGGFYAVWGQGSPVVDIDRVVRGLGKLQTPSRIQEQAAQESRQVLNGTKRISRSKPTALKRPITP